MPKELIMYSRSKPCPFVNTAKRVLENKQIPYREIRIDEDKVAYQRVIDWTGFESVPTLVVAKEGEILPIEAPSFLAKGASPRGIDRGYMITEPNANQLEDWLEKHGFLNLG